MKLKLTVRPDLMFARQYDSSIFELISSNNTTDYIETNGVVENDNEFYRVSNADYQHIEKYNSEEFQCKIQNNVVIITTTTTYIPHTAI